MKQILIAACILSFATMGCDDSKKSETVATGDTTATMSDNKMEETSTPPPPVDSATMMRNWQAYMTPGEPHKLMASWTGSWSGEVTMWHAPNTPPITSKATAVNKMAMGGRYLVGNHTGDMMGMPFEGTSTMAYDNAKKRYISTWIDNMGTGVMTMEGTWDEATKTMNMSGKCVDPSRGDGTEITMREVFRIVDANSHVMEMYGPGPDGKEYKVMEMKLTRKS